MTNGPDENGNVQIYAAPVGITTYHVGIYFRINLTDQPMFKVIHGGRRFWLDGTILEAGTGYVVATCANIRWDDEDPTK